jgi:uncharacterized protein
LHTGALHWSILKKLAQAAQLSGGQHHDARIAAICLENAVNELWSADRDFSRFPQIKVRNPLIHTKGTSKNPWFFEETIGTWMCQPR